MAGASILIHEASMMMKLLQALSITALILLFKRLVIRRPPSRPSRVQKDRWSKIRGYRRSSQVSSLRQSSCNPLHLLQQTQGDQAVMEFAPRVCAGEQSGGRKCAVDGGATCGDVCAVSQCMVLYQGTGALTCLPGNRCCGLGR